MTHIRNKYPSCARCIYEDTNQTHKLRSYENYCKEFETDPDNYFLYVLGYFLPEIDKKRAEGSLKTGK